MKNLNKQNIIKIIVFIVFLTAFAYLYSKNVQIGDTDNYPEDTQYTETISDTANEVPEDIVNSVDIADSDNEEQDNEELNAEESDTIVEEPGDNEQDANIDDDEVKYYFRNDKLLTQHYEKHGIEMGFDSKESYEAAASKVVTNPNSLHKLEGEDGDDVYYLEETNEFVIVSTDGYIRTYFLPSGGKKYYDKQ